MSPVGRWSLHAKGPHSARSSHCITATKGGQLTVYGGEFKPRVPVDAASRQEGSDVVRGSVHIVKLGKRKGSISDRLKAWTTLNPSLPPRSTAGAVTSTAERKHVDIPDARVGPSMVMKDDAVYLWGGRGGVDMAPLEHPHTGVWRGQLFQSGKDNVVWEHLTAEGSPEPRSYHTAISLDNTMYIHAGCPATGRLSTLHSFDLATHKWQALSSAPDPPRGGTSIVGATLPLSKPVLIRYGGFSGYELPKEEGIVDIYAVRDDQWLTVTPTADPDHGVPGARSVHGFQPFKSSSPSLSDAVAVLFYGEKDASSLGHAGAGAFWNDVWLLSKDQTTSETDGWRWTKVFTEDSSVPEGRGWFASAEWEDDGTSRVVMHGGLLSSNERSDELWVLDIV